MMSNGQEVLEDILNDKQININKFSIKKNSFLSRSLHTCGRRFVFRPTTTMKESQVWFSGALQSEREGKAGGMFHPLEHLIVDVCPACTSWTDVVDMALSMFTVATMQMLAGHTGRMRPGWLDFSVTSLQVCSLTCADLRDRRWTGKPLNVNDGRKWKTPKLPGFACAQKQQVDEFVFQKRRRQGRNEAEVLVQTIDHSVL